jgi:ABC-2 type transport system ATP-binding protein
MIKVDGLSRYYGDFFAVKDATFTIGQGEIVGLLGHNGAGKTTIMKMITGYLEPSAGSVELNGMQLNDQAEEIQALIGYLPESLPVYPEMSVMDYLFYCADMRKIAKQDQDKCVRDAIAKTQLEEKALQAISTLSRGFKQRVGVAQALLHEPKVLILDEPTNGLDPHQTQQMRDLIKALSSHATVILSTHIMQEVEALCERVIILDGGQIAVDKALADLQQLDSIILSTDAELNNLQSLISDATIEQLEGTGSHNNFRIKPTVTENLTDFCSNLSQKLFQKNHAVSALSPQFENLEQIFHNIHEQREVNNAA